MKLRNLIFFKFILIISRLTIIFIIELNLLGIGYAYFINTMLRNSFQNFTIIYIRSGFPRLPIEKQAELVPTIVNALRDKPTSHLDNLLLLIVPLLGKVKVPTEPEKIKTYFGLNKNPDVSKHFLEILLDVLLLPYR